MPNLNPGQRINGARDKGRAAALAGKPSTDNPYSRPNMAAAWLEGWTDAQTPTATDDGPESCDDADGDGVTTAFAVALDTGAVH